MLKGLPHEDVGVVTQELCKGRFHVRGHVGTYAEPLLEILRMDLDHLGVIGQAEGRRWVPFRSIKGLFTRLELDSGEIGGGEVSRGKGHALLLAAVHLGRGGGDHDDPPWAMHLELQAAIVRDSHELRIT